MLELANNLNWNLRFRGSFNAATGDESGTYVRPDPIPPLSIDIKSPILAIGVGSETAKPGWFRGAFANVRFKFKPSSTSTFQSRMEVASDRQTCRLGYLSLIDFTSWGISNLELQLAFPFYLKDVYVEIWEYSFNLTGEFKPPQDNHYAMAEDLKAIRAYFENKTFDLRIVNE